MGGKKKGKANKLARMSEEEKMRYLQHRAAIEEEARRRKEQLISTFMKNKLKREEAFSRLNMAKINQQWRQTLRQLKCVELKQDVEDLYKWFDYSATKKNEKVDTLLEDLEEAESQYFRISTNQMETFDKLIKLHKQRINYFYEQYKRERDEVYQKATEELKEMTDSFLSDEEHLQATLYRMEEAYQETVAALASRHVSKMDELRNNMLTELENLKNSREQEIEKIWAKLESIIKQYWEQTEDRRRQYVVMKDVDHENCRQIFENNQQINAAAEVINNLKEQLTKVQAASEEQFLERSTKKENSRRLLYSLKKKVSEELEIDKKNLNFMSGVASKTTHELKRILERGEKILQLQSLCRKLETENEKICPEEFEKGQLTEEEEEEVQKQAQDYSEPLAARAYNDLVKLDKFWKRYNRVLLEKEALALHRQSLETEQKHLISELKGYLSEVVVKRPESKVSYANGVRVPRRRPFTCAPIVRKTRPAITCIEATQSPSIREILSAQMRRS